MNLRRHILIFHQAALGDFIMTWPLAMALGRVFAQSRVMYVTGPDKGRLAEDVLGVEWLGADNGWHTLFGEAEPPEDPVGKRLRTSQCVVLFAERDEPTFVNHVRRIAGDIPIITIRPNPPPGLHVMAHQLAQLKDHGALGGYVEQMQTLIRTQGIANRSQPSGKLVLIHPGSGSRAKNWPLASFIETAQLLKAAGKEVRFILGEVEREQFATSDVEELAEIAPVIWPAELLPLREAISGASAFIGNDSGPTHLASVLGLRTVTLFGPASSADQWQPIGPRVSVLQFSATPQSVADAALSP